MNPFARLRERMRHAQDRRRLLRLDDRLLADIGLSRHDVESLPEGGYAALIQQRRRMF